MPGYRDQAILDYINRMTSKTLEKDQDKMESLINQRKKELETIKNSDALYMSRASITTGMINIHDIAWGDEGLWVVNSTFSCLSTLSSDCSFIARWKPPFISKLVPEDRCHLNGMAMLNGKPKYVTTFNQLDEKDSFLTEKFDSGTLIDVDTNEILINDLIMPHSPRIYNGVVYICDSGNGRVLSYNPETKQTTEVIKLPGFTRGINFHGPLMFVGLSKVRIHEDKEPLPISKEHDTTVSGIWIINLEDNQEIAHLVFEGDIEQIYDIAVVPNSINPEILSIDDSLIRHAYEFQEKLV